VIWIQEHVVYAKKNMTEDFGRERCEQRRTNEGRWQQSFWGEKRDLETEKEMQHKDLTIYPQRYLDHIANFRYDVFWS